MFAGGLQGNMLRPALKSITVETEAECACQSDERRSLPIAPESIHPPEHLFAALHEPLHQECIHPGMHLHRLHLAHMTVTAGIILLCTQLLIACTKTVRHRQHILSRRQTAVCQGLGVICQNHVQHGVVVGSVPIVPVTEPITGPNMNLYVADPQSAVQANLGIEEIRSLVAVVLPHIQNFQ